MLFRRPVNSYAVIRGPQVSFLLLTIVFTLQIAENDYLKLNMTTHSMMRIQKKNSRKFFKSEKRDFFFRFFFSLITHLKT